MIALLAQAAEFFTFETLAKFGTVGVVAGLSWWFTKHHSTQQKETTATFASTIKDSHDCFAKSIEEQGKRYKEQTTELIAQCRERERELIEALKEHRRTA